MEAITIDDATRTENYLEVEINFGGNETRRIVIDLEEEPTEIRIYNKDRCTRHKIVFGGVDIAYFA